MAPPGGPARDTPGALSSCPPTVGPSLLPPAGGAQPAASWAEGLVTVTHTRHVSGRPAGGREGDSVWKEGLEEGQRRLAARTQAQPCHTETCWGHSCHPRTGCLQTDGQEANEWTRSWQMGFSPRGRGGGCGQSGRRGLPQETLVNAALAVYGPVPTPHSPTWQSTGCGSGRSSGAFAPASQQEAQRRDRLQGPCSRLGRNEETGVLTRRRRRLPSAPSLSCGH